MNTGESEKKQIIPAGSSQLSIRSGSLVLRGLKDLELFHKSQSASDLPKQAKDLTSLVKDPVVADILIGIGEEYFNNGMADKSEWHAVLYDEAEDIAEGLGDVLEPLFPDIWKSVTGETDYIGGIKGIYGEQVNEVNGFKPDYGLRLVQDGVSSEVNLHFHNFRLYSIKVIGPSEFTTMVEMPYAGKLYALSLDFNKAQLEEILTKASPELRKYIEDCLATNPSPQQTIHLKGCICFGVRARLGKIEKAPKEYFVPLIAQEIFDV